MGDLHDKKIRKGVLKILDCKARGTMLPSGLWMEIHDLIFSMCHQCEPFNFSERVYRATADYPKLLYSSLTPKATDVDSLHEFVERMKTVPRPEILAKEIERVYHYLSRFYIPTKNYDSINKNVLNAWALMDWSDIVDKTIAFCKPIVRSNPILVRSIVSQMLEFLPATAILERHKLKKLEKLAVTHLISDGISTYNQQHGLGVAPTGVCGIIAEFALDL